MRQAGRSLPEYRQSRAGVDMLEACLRPELAAEITLQPVRRHGVDAAVFFSDIVTPVLLAGVDVSIVAGRGPVLAEPVRTASDVLLQSIDLAVAAEAIKNGAQDYLLKPIDPAVLQPISEAVALVVAELGDIPLVGFGGAPYTLASYLVEGGPSKEQLRTRALMKTDPHTWAALLNWCADVTGAFVRAQVEAGASIVQLFDSWAGSLSRADYQRRVAPHTRRAFDALRGFDVPKIHFGLGLSEVLDLVPPLGADVVGVDWRLPLDVAAMRIGRPLPLQGNIDPALLTAPWPVLAAHIDDVLARGADLPGHILNLGHGVPPETDPTVLTRIVEYVHGR